MMLEPSPAAYQSAWDRDNIYRQSVSFFAILWFVHPTSRDTPHPPFQTTG